jgi:type IV pilus assembly protein PilM
MKIFKDRRPRIACEFSSTQLVAARAAADGSVGAPFVCALPPGALTPDLLATNIPGRDAVRVALEDAKAKLGGRDREMAVILPDASFRMTLLELDVLPQKHEEADALVRLRLRKSLPFEVGKARVCWQAQKANGKTTVLAAATLTAVLEEYESVVREAGFSPGLVLPSVLASLRVVDAGVPTLLIKVDPTTTGIAIVKDLAVVLVRILEGTSGQRMEGTRLAGEVHSSLMFLQDVYGTKVEKIVVSGTASLDELNKVLEASTGVQAQELVGAVQLGPDSSHPLSVLGALSGALV